jgi:hypothetical protein
VISENTWKVEKKTNPLIAALFPMPDRISDVQISNFCAVQERDIQMRQKVMPRYTREQYRCAFEEYVQKYSWEVAVENSGWGTLEQYAAKHNIETPAHILMSLHVIYGKIEIRARLLGGTEFPISVQGVAVSKENLESALINQIKV